MLVNGSPAATPTPRLLTAVIRPPRTVVEVLRSEWYSNFVLKLQSTAFALLVLDAALNVAIILSPVQVTRVK